MRRMDAEVGLRSVEAPDRPTGPGLCPVDAALRRITMAPLTAAIVVGAGIAGPASALAWRRIDVDAVISSSAGPTTSTSHQTRDAV